MYSPAALFAQTERGNITGVVTDSTNAAVPAATVVITNIATNQAQQVVTTNTGEYNVPGLPPGTYRIDASATGFEKTIRDNVVLDRGQHVTCRCTA